MLYYYIIVAIVCGMRIGAFLLRVFLMKKTGQAEVIENVVCLQSRNYISIKTTDIPFSAAYFYKPSCHTEFRLKLQPVRYLRVSGLVI